jgi:hypothetical protein
MDLLLALPGGLEQAFWQSQPTRQRLRLADTLGLCCGLVVHLALLALAEGIRFKELLFLTLALQLAQVSHCMRASLNTCGTSLPAIIPLCSPTPTTTPIRPS